MSCGFAARSCAAARDPSRGGAQLRCRPLTAQSEPPEDRALAFLGHEVPRWSRENHCFSCHNNGDGARALYAGFEAGFTIAPAVTEDTTAWLSDPARWEHNGGDGPFSDKRLARLQFTAALAAARRAGARARPAAPRFAQPEPAGSRTRPPTDPGPWKERTSQARPSSMAASWRPTWPVRACGPPTRSPSRNPIDRADRWLLGHEIKTITDASVMLMATASVSSPRSPAHPGPVPRAAPEGPVRHRGMGAVRQVAARGLRHGARLDRAGAEAEIPAPHAP